MLTENELLEKFSEKSICHGNMVLFPLAIAFDFIDACDDNEFRVLGIEGFSLDGEYVTPHIDMIFDCSLPGPGDRAERRSVCNGSARAFLEELPESREGKQLVVEFVLIED